MNIGEIRIRNPAMTMVLAVTLLNVGCANPGTDQQATAETRQTNTQESEVGDKQLASATIAVDVIIIDKARDSNLLDQVMQGVNDIYQQCQIAVTFEAQSVDLTAGQVIDKETRTNLADEYNAELATLFFVSRTAEADVGFAYLPSGEAPLASSIWVTERVSEACLPWVAAHEIGHVLLDSGKHSNGLSNVMSNGCTANNWSNSAASPKWTIKQCLALHQSPFIVP